MILPDRRLVEEVLQEAVRLEEPRAVSRGSRLRARLVGAGLLFGYGLLIWRLYGIQIVEHERWVAAAERQHVRMREEPATRGRLLFQDNGRVVPAAESLTQGSLMIEGRPDRDPQAFVARLEEALGELSAEERADTLARLERGRAFYFRRRKLDLDQVAALRQVRLPQAGIELEQVRVRPFRALAAQTLGLVGSEGQGLGGLERAFEQDLRGEPGQREVQLDNRRRELALPGGLVVPARPGCDIVLSLNRSVQAVVEAELAALAEEHRPQGAAAVVVDVATGSILAMGSWPDFDPDQVGGDFQDGLRNRCIGDTYEPGSTIKPFLVGQAWELGLGGPERPINCPRTLKVPGRKKPIEDSHTVGSVREEDVLVQSSNTGSYQIAARLSPEQIVRLFEAIGLGSASGVGLAGEARGNTSTLAKIGPTTLGSLAQGYAFSVTPLQMALAYAALANGGTRYAPRLVEEVRDPTTGAARRRWEPRPVARPLSASTTDKLRQAMTRVTEDERGTARRARAPSYLIAGKTGTTKMLVDGRYHEREVVASFCGYAPADAPRIAFCVVAWGPDTSKQRAWGGTVAAPAAGRIAEQVLRLMQVPPSPARLATPLKAPR